MQFRVSLPAEVLFAINDELTSSYFSLKMPSTSTYHLINIIFVDEYIAVEGVVE